MTDNPSLEGVRPITEGGTVGLPDLLALVRPPAWHRDAACLEHPELTWFPDRHQTAVVGRARAVCQRCLVRAECLAFALEVPDMAGIWGGTTPKQRAALRREAIDRGVIVAHVGPKASDQRKRTRKPRRPKSVDPNPTGMAVPPTPTPTPIRGDDDAAQ